jgi:hypothetical protein
LLSGSLTHICPFFDCSRAIIGRKRQITLTFPDGSVGGYNKIKKAKMLAHDETEQTIAAAMECIWRDCCLLDFVKVSVKNEKMRGEEEERVNVDGRACCFTPLESGILCFCSKMKDVKCCFERNEVRAKSYDEI